MIDWVSPFDRKAYMEAILLSHLAAMKRRYDIKRVRQRVTIPGRQPSLEG
jgi:hypothetical protein